MFIATFIAVILFFLQIKIPSVLLDSMNYIADMNTPLAMMVAGFSVAQADIGKCAGISKSIIHPQSSCSCSLYV